MKKKSNKIYITMVAAILFGAALLLSIQKNETGKLTFTKSAHAGDENNPGLFGTYTETGCDQRYDKWVVESTTSEISYTTKTNIEVAGKYKKIFDLTGTVTLNGVLAYKYTVTTSNWRKAKQIRCPSWSSLCGSFEVDCGQF